MLKKFGFLVDSIFDFESLNQEQFDESNGIIIDSDLLNLRGSVKLSKLSKNQPYWSDVPIFILMNAPVHPLSSARVKKIREAFGNVTILDKPILTRTLVSLIKSGWSYRSRQRDVRAVMEQNARELAWRARMEIDLRAARDAADSANRAKSAFLANLSHEIRTPLSAILGFSEILKTDELSPQDRRQYLSTIERNGQELMILINDVLDLSKIESGHQKPEIIITNTRQLLADVEKTLELKAQLRKNSLAFEISPELPHFVLTDPMRLRQILINIIGNAIKFTMSGSIRVTATGRKIDENSRFFDLSFAVTDTGSGISPQGIENLFYPFMQADSSTTRNYGGTGLGLTLSRRFAQSLGGDVVLKATKLGAGSTFVATIRAEGITDKNLGAEKCLRTLVLDKPAEAAPLADLKFLLVEDTIDNQVLIRKILEVAGADVDLANDGLEALEKCSLNDYDAVLMDVQMPKMDGYQATDTLRKRGFLKPIIALTAHAFSDEAAKSFAAGCTMHLSKPIDRKNLIRILQQVCSTCPLSVTKPH